MLSNDLTQIQLLNPVRINFQLKKHYRPPSNNPEESVKGGSIGVRTMSAGTLSEFDSDGFDDLNDEWPRRDANVWNGVPFSIRTQFNSVRKRAIAEAYVRFRLLFIKPLKNPIEIFDEIKGNFLEISDEKVDEAEMKTLLTKLELSKQRNVINQVKQDAKIKQAQALLYEAGFRRYQTEASLITFIKRVKKGLCLTEIDNFDRVIPDGPAKFLTAAEELKVFDNYYILHYDKSKGKNPFYTEKEPKPKDPILFGVIAGSTNLYFIADWIDEFCDLTYKDLLKQTCGYELKKP